MPRRSLTLLAGVCAALVLGACGSQDNDVLDSQESATIKRGSDLFVRNCAMCHTLSVVGATGTSEQIHDRERVDGPNFDTRPETVDGILYAIRNGGFSGAIMPENIVVGEDARAVAEFLAKYAGKREDASSNPAGDDAGEGEGELR